MRGWRWGRFSRAGVSSAWATSLVTPRESSSKESELLPFAVERGGIDAQRPRGLLEISGDGENAANVFGFECIDGHTGTDHDARLRFRTEFVGQIVHFDDFARGKNYSPLDHVAQFAQVARPFVACKRR